jgi:CheY-like chemotaxis protein
MSASKAEAAILFAPNEAASALSEEARWGVIIVYGDAPAGEHALYTIEKVSHHLGGSIALYPSLWRFDLLEDPDWRAAATAEAVQAGLVVISTSSRDDLPVAVRDWVQGCLQAKTSAAGALVALLGPADAMDSSDSPRIRFLRNAAEAAGFGFFAPTPAEAPNLRPGRPAARILLVEDEIEILQYNTMVLVRGGYQVTGVEGCEAAWEAIQSASYDLLVTDNQMPGMSGLELVSKLRSAQFGLPIIVASGGIEAEEFAQSQSLQPAFALPKPFTADQLLALVAESLRRAGRDPAHTEVSFYASSEAHSHWGLNE